MRAVEPREDGRRRSIEGGTEDRSTRWPDKPAPCYLLDRADVLTPWSLGALSLFERDRLALTEPIEGHAVAGRLVEEILVPVVGENESKTLFTDEALNRTVDS